MPPVIFMLFDDFPCLIECLCFKTLDDAKEYAKESYPVNENIWAESEMSGHVVYYCGSCEIHVFN